MKSPHSRIEQDLDTGSGYIMPLSAKTDTLRASIGEKYRSLFPLASSFC